jgi:hypothetical protein
MEAGKPLEGGGGSGGGGVEGEGGGMGGGVREIGGKRVGSFAFVLNKPCLSQHKINTPSLRFQSHHCIR